MPHGKVPPGFVGARRDACHMPGYIRNKHTELVAFTDPRSRATRRSKKNFPARAATRRSTKCSRKKNSTSSACVRRTNTTPPAPSRIKRRVPRLCEKPIAASCKAVITQSPPRNRRAEIHDRVLAPPVPRADQVQSYASEKAIGKPFMIRVVSPTAGPTGWAKDNGSTNPTWPRAAPLLDRASTRSTLRSGSTAPSPPYPRRPRP